MTADERRDYLSIRSWDSQLYWYLLGAVCLIFLTELSGLYICMLVVITLAPLGGVALDSHLAKDADESIAEPDEQSGSIRARTPDWWLIGVFVLGVFYALSIHLLGPRKVFPVGTEAIFTGIVTLGLVGSQRVIRAGLLQESAEAPGEAWHPFKQGILVVTLFAGAAGILAAEFYGPVWLAWLLLAFYMLGAQALANHDE